VNFSVIGEIRKAETFAIGTAIREIERLKKQYGKGRWRKRKGIAEIELAGRRFMVELHWYEATGLGRKEYKIKQLIKEL
jgi:hypothetical protein